MIVMAVTAVIAAIYCFFTPIAWQGGVVVGRPLRIRGRPARPSMRDGDEWTRGEQPNPERLDVFTVRHSRPCWRNARHVTDWSAEIRSLGTAFRFRADSIRHPAITM
jgi:hypothetical protein